MANQWTKGEIYGFLTKANPYVRLFFKALTRVEKGSISELKMPATSIAMSMRAFNVLKKKPLFNVDKSGKPPIYSIDKTYRKAITSFFSKFKETRMPKKKTRKKKVVRRKASGVKRGRKPGRPPRPSGVISIPAKYSDDLEFWVNFIQAVNAAKGKQIVIVTDGKSISLRME